MLWNPYVTQTVSLVYLGDVLFLVNFYCIFDLRQINFLLRIYFLQTLLKLNFFLWRDHTKSLEQFFSVGFWYTQPATTLNQSSGWKLVYIYIYIYIYLSISSIHLDSDFLGILLNATIWLHPYIYFLGTVARHVLCHPPGAMVKRATKTCWKAMLYVLSPTFEPVLQQIV